MYGNGFSDDERARLSDDELMQLYERQADEIAEHVRTCERPAKGIACSICDDVI